MPQLPLDSRYRQRRRTTGYLKSLTPYLGAFILFSVGLVCYSLLSQLYSPASVDQLGWQAWDTIDFELHKQEQIAPGNDTHADVDVGLPLGVWVSATSTWLTLQDPVAKHTSGSECLPSVGGAS
jgi:hypothetical protein